MERDVECRSASHRIARASRACLLAMVMIVAAGPPADASASGPRKELRVRESRARWFTERVRAATPFLQVVGGDAQTLASPPPPGMGDHLALSCDDDADSDGVADCHDLCRHDSTKIVPGLCGCGRPDDDTDGDGAPDCFDLCPNDPEKTEPDTCGCDVSDIDSDGDYVSDCDDLCPSDPLKTDPGACGCHAPEDDTDGDRLPNCVDECPLDPRKGSPGSCGCGVRDQILYVDADHDGFGDTSSARAGCAPSAGFVSLGGDCNDADPKVHPCAVEDPENRVDDDCDALIDEPKGPVREVACENALPGEQASTWEVFGVGSLGIQGFATDISVNHGETVSFKIKTNAASYRIDIYRLGYYAGLGARRVATIDPLVTLPQAQPDCLFDPADGLVDCGNWEVSAAWDVPPDATSGIYIARPERTDPGHEGEASHIVFVVRDDERHADLLFQTSDMTWQAYNFYGGTSLYLDQTFDLPAHRAFKVSYNRPVITRTLLNALQGNFLFNAEYPMLRWLEANGFDVSYCAGVDTDRSGSELLEHSAFLSVGHDEYWTGDQRANVEAARELGVNLCFFSGNEVFWKARWEPSIDAARDSHRTLVCYKETKAHAKIDPLPDVWTGTWRDPRFSPPADGGRPENALTGTLYRINGPQHGSIEVPADFGALRFWRNTSVAALTPGEVARLSSGMLGHEYDEIADNGFLPPGLIRLSSTTTWENRMCLLDYGARYGSCHATHSLSMYRAASGALVFGAGTIQWSWGLDDDHDRGRSVPDARAQQATVNLLADMHAFADTLQPGLVPAEPSTDFTPPIAVILYPEGGATVPNCRPVTIHGTAVDVGGGVVAAVEVSLDQGATWHAASGRSVWSYVMPPGPAGMTRIIARAVDDSGNLEEAYRPIIVTRQPAESCPHSLWNSSAIPALSSRTDLASTEVGVRFTCDVDGLVAGLRYYKGPGNNGSNKGHLWSASGVLLGTLDFPDTATLGWQEGAFATPIPISAGAFYVAAYHSQLGGYAFDEHYFANKGVDSGLIHAHQSTAESPNGVVRYGRTAFPSASYLDSNYWVDVIFEPDLSEW